MRAVEAFVTYLERERETWNEFARVSRGFSRKHSLAILERERECCRTRRTDPRVGRRARPCEGSPPRPRGCRSSRACSVLPHFRERYTSRGRSLVSDMLKGTTSSARAHRSSARRSSAYAMYKSKTRLFRMYIYISRERERERRNLLTLGSFIAKRLSTRAGARAQARRGRL